MKAMIKYISGYVPDTVVTCSDIEERINVAGNKIASGSIERLFGVKERRFVERGIQASDLAVNAALPILEKINKDEIDCLLFAAASGDLIEPATANIVQYKLSLNCAAIDIKNACNSFVSALQVASSFIISKQYKNILIVTGEVLQHAIKFNVDNNDELKKRLASYTLGDGGGAALVVPSNDESGLIYQQFKSIGKHWSLCTILGGGSMFPHDMNKYFFEGKTTELKDVLINERGSFFEDCLINTGWKLEDIDLIFTHQVSVGTFDVIAKCFGIPEEKFVNVVHKYGNTASASIPLAMSEAYNTGRLMKGDKILIVGLAAGVSLSIQSMIW